ncbi:endonuclease/exonuclease/phosphatase family protein [Coralloluteibacterium stylophorae]|uniref:Endonuclease/exonuclease/phosphatase family protein n=1 Tax=Coralloluteibacterium stylophorae TaxID=1776034 RepID=A0A8J8AY80_9GAMM|nr:endonuclease/exonuclease/phosphatase family protein [Coralloluteibacterium stylophorae]MBS7456494.1 endonuclease/exonuclease/phosphatase family protein [Coralloluteibacterium stylophorae]
MPNPPPHLDVRDAPAPSSLTVLTINTHKGFTALNRRFILQELREAVRAVSADVVFLQEVLGMHSRHASRHSGWPDAPQYEYLADSMWSDFAYGRNAVYPEGDHGNAVLSKYPILRYDNRDISVAGHETRGLLHCVLDVPGQRDGVHAICVHLGLREAEREAQLALLCGVLAEEVPEAAPVVVAGDFNDWRRRGHPRLLGCGMTEAFDQAYGRCARTFPARFPVLPLDRIYFRNVRAHRPQVLTTRPWSHLSDHAPLATDIAL